MKTVVITGVGKGIGKALSEKFLSEGWFVIGTVYDPEEAQESKCSKTIPLYLSSSDSVVQCINEIIGLDTRIDIVINNAGCLLDRDETRVVIEKLRKTLEVNLIGTIDFTERLLPLVNKGGHIVNISSTAGSLERTGFPGASNFPFLQPSYKISKAALNMYTRTLALRLQEEEIFVSSIHPGWVKTDMGSEDADRTPEEASEEIFNFAISPKDTGGFWSGESRVPW
jgi:NAD(P)-dependent dehydrogenase (short-subunit alcohol dehydrogenase family)